MIKEKVVSWYKIQRKGRMKKPTSFVHKQEIKKKSYNCEGFLGYKFHLQFWLW